MPVIKFESPVALGDEVVFDADVAAPRDAPELKGWRRGRVVGVSLAECGPRSTAVWALVEVGDTDVYEIEAFADRLRLAL